MDGIGKYDSSDMKLFAVRVTIWYYLVFKTP